MDVPSVSYQNFDIDIGNLLVTDIDYNPTFTPHISEEQVILSHAQKCVQAILTELSSLPIDVEQDIPVIKLPEGSTKLPRAKIIPKVKPLTKWERFARDKGINRKKRSRMEWDESAQEWKPRWGYKRAKPPADNQWCIEVPEGKDPYIDYFDEAKQERKEKIAKNEFHRVKNLLRNEKGKIKAPTIETGHTEKTKNRKHLQRMSGLAKLSTPSLGKFSKEVKGEQKSIKGQKRKFDPVIGDLNAERNKQLALLDKMNKNKPSVNFEKEVNKFIDEQQKARNKAKTNDSITNIGGTKRKTQQRKTIPNSLKYNKSKFTKNNRSQPGRKVQKKLKRLEGLKKRMKL